MKTLIKRLTLCGCLLSPLAAHADEQMSTNKNCDKEPISRLGYEQLNAFSEYKNNKSVINQALIDFCKRGKSEIPNMGFPTLKEIMISESDSWVNKQFPQKREINADAVKRIKELLVLSGMNGFTGFSFPKPPEPENTQQDLLPFNYESYCSSSAENAAKKLAAQLPGNVSISEDSWNKTLTQLYMICTGAFWQGAMGEPVSQEMVDGLNETSKQLYVDAYDEGLKNQKTKDGMNEVKKQSSKTNDEEINDLLAGLSGGKKPENYGAEFASLIKKRLTALSGENSKGSLLGTCHAIVRVSQHGDIVRFTMKENSNTNLCGVVKDRLHGLKFPVINQITDITLNVDNNDARKG